MRLARRDVDAPVVERRGVGLIVLDMSSNPEGIGTA
jgi:hypothetical protein